MSYIKTNIFYAGEGNKLFVYFYGLIFSEKFKIPYIHAGIPSLKIDSTLHLKIKNNKTSYKIVNYLEELDKDQINSNTTYILNYGFNPTIEDYKIYLPYINFLKNKFTFEKKDIDKEDLVYHLRAGDALLINNYNYFDSIKLNNLINSITYKKLYVVTNLEKKDLWTMDDLNKYKVKLLKKGDCGSYYKESNLINNIQMLESLKKLNSIIKILYDKNAIWISNTILSDFNFIRSCNKIIIGISTFSWWAAVLSDAEKVYSPKNWKYLKGKKNKNLSQTELNNWNSVDF